ncbi:MAG: hypothetical protein HY897_06145, partial [Deltaproteobacteria bacterium]|nr:hypothetical protein [Deltaproteobacteria bacterium]
NEVSEGSFTYDVTFSVVRADKKSKEKVLSSISATGSPVVMTQSIPFGLPAPIYTYCRDTDLRRAVAPWTDPTSEAPLATEWNYSDNVRSLWGRNLNIRPADVGCYQSDLSDAIRCVLLHFSAHVGITDPSELQFEHETVEPDGDRVFRYLQLYSGLPVEGSNVIVRTTPGGAVTSVFSAAVAGIIGGAPAVTSPVSAEDSNRAAAKATELNGGSPLVVVEDSPVVWIDRSKKATRAHAARKLVLSDPAGELFDGLFVADQDRFVSLEKRMGRFAAPQMTYTKVAYPVHSTTQCYPWLCGTNYVCDTDSTPSMCVKKCTNPANPCPTGWRCWDSSSSEPGYCFLQDDSANGILIYSSSLFNPWITENYRNFEPFANLVQVTHDVQDFHYTKLKRRGWDNGDSPYITVFNSNCCAVGDPSCDYAENCGGSADANGSRVRYHSWSRALKDWEMEPYYKMVSYCTVGHEWGHNIVFKTAGSMLSGGRSPDRPTHSSTRGAESDSRKAPTRLPTNWSSSTPTLRPTLGIQPGRGATDTGESVFPEVRLCVGFQEEPPFARWSWRRRCALLRLAQFPKETLISAATPIRAWTTASSGWTP